MLRVLDLFSGIGGFSLGLERTGGFKTVAFCEIEPYCQAVLRKHWPSVPIFNDVRKLRGEDVGPVDVICGGFPCQPFSHAGKRLGREDNRSLWPEYRRIIEELRPTWVIGENVIGIVGMELDNVLADLEGMGYACRPFDIPACALGANHERRRIWIIAHSSGVGSKRSWDESCEPSKIGQGRKDHAEACEESNASNAMRERQQGQGRSERQCDTEENNDWEVSRTLHALGWPTEPPVCSANDGVSRRVARNQLSALGNAVVPQIPEILGRAILEAEGRQAIARDALEQERLFA